MFMFMKALAKLFSMHNNLILSMFNVNFLETRQGALIEH